MGDRDPRAFPSAKEDLQLVVPILSHDDRIVPVVAATLSSADTLEPQAEWFADRAKELAVAQRQTAEDLESRAARAVRRGDSQSLRLAASRERRMVAAIEHWLRS